jgi:hypothetical protein
MTGKWLRLLLIVQFIGVPSPRVMEHELRAAELDACEGTARFGNAYMTVIHTNVVSIFGAETIHDLAGELAREYIVVPYGKPGSFFSRRARQRQQAN